MSAPRVVPDPLRSAPELLVFCLAALASFFAAGYALGGWLWDRITEQEAKP